MRAAVYDTSGEERGVLRVVDRPDPEPGPGEVRVRVHVSGVNPTDWKARESGVHRAWAEQVPNQDGAGVIDAVGPGVGAERVGERVWVWHAASGRPTGTAAQYVCLPQGQAVPLPDDVSFDHGAGLGIPAMTAHYCLFADGPVEGRTVLVTGGAGAVGHAAVQLARWSGAQVVATVSSAEKARLAETAGAQVVLNYRADDYPEQLAAAAREGLHRVVDVALAANLSGYLDHLAPHAVVAVYAQDREEAHVPILPLMRRNVLLRFMLIYGVAQPLLERAVAEVDEALRAGALQPLPVHRYPL